LPEVALYKVNGPVNLVRLNQSSTRPMATRCTSALGAALARRAAAAHTFDLRVPA